MTKSRIKCACALILLAIPVVVILILLQPVIIPNYYGGHFQIGTCTLKTEAPPDQDNFVWKDCSCGTLCTSKFPCISLLGFFTPYGCDEETGAKREGSFHQDYEALKKSCYMQPRECRKSPYNNSYELMSVIEEEFEGRWNSSETFPCWGHGDTFFLTNDYSKKRADLALFLPVAILITLVIILYAISKPFRDCCFVEVQFKLPNGPTRTLSL